MQSFAEDVLMRRKRLVCLHKLNERAAFPVSLDSVRPCVVAACREWLLYACSVIDRSIIQQQRWAVLAQAPPLARITPGHLELSRRRVDVGEDDRRILKAPSAGKERFQG